MSDIESANRRAATAIERLGEELKKLRTGRAHPSMLDGVQVEAYGQKIPLKQVGTITVLDAQMLQITPFDPHNLAAISTAIREDQSLGLNPADDGRVVRVPIPPLTAERRQQIVRQLNEKAEETNVALRNIRHDALNEAKRQLKDKTIGEDDFKRLERQITDLMDNTRRQVEQVAKAKEQEILTV